MDPDQHHNALNRDDLLHWYEIKSILGQGGFGITYLARDTNLDRLFAIKEYLPGEFSTRDASSTVQPISENHTEVFEWGKKRFLDEAKTLAQFTHPNIIRVHSFFENNNTGYMVMEYEEGTDLSELIKAGEKFDEARLLGIIVPVLDGLELVHAQGFIHRDIKPPNIFIRRDGSPVLIDFGSARQALGGQTRTMTSLVTPGYAPFEQYHDAEGKQGPWTDIYSLGATLYCAITGKPPVESLKRGLARVEHNTDAYLKLVDLKSGQYSDHFLRAVDCALEFLASDRPASVTDWKRMLRGELEVPVAAASTELYQAPEPVEDTAEITAATEVEVPAVPPTPDPVDVPLSARDTRDDAVPARKRPWPMLMLVGVVLLLGATLAGVLLRGTEPAAPEAQNAGAEQALVEQLQAELEQQSARLQQVEVEREAEAERLRQEQAALELRQREVELEAQLQAAAEAEEVRKAEARRQAELKREQEDLERRAKLKKEKELARQQAQKQELAEQKKREELARQQAQERRREALRRQAELAALEAEKASESTSAITQQESSSDSVPVFDRPIERSTLEASGSGSSSTASVEVFDRPIERATLESSGSGSTATAGAEVIDRPIERATLQKTTAASLAGSYEAQITYAKGIGSFKKYAFGNDPQIQVELTQEGDRIKGTFSGDRSGEIEGRLEQGTVNFKWFITGGGNSTSGSGQWVLGADQTGLTGNWEVRTGALYGDWNLKPR